MSDSDAVALLPDTLFGAPVVLDESLRSGGIEFKDWTCWTKLEEQEGDAHVE
jgi:hypothetical protein